MPDSVEHILVGLLAWTAVMALSVAVPQGALLIRLWIEGNRVVPYTLKTVAWTGSIGILLTWRCLVFWDTFFFESYYLGPISDRWSIEVVLAVLLVAAVTYGAVLYHWTITFRHGVRGSTGIPRPAAKPTPPSKTGGCA